MAMFQAEIAFLFELALFGAGLILLHFGRQASAPLLRAAAYVLLVGATATAICTVYYSVRYHVQGEFDRAYPQHHPSRMATRHPMMGGGMMGRPGPAAGAEGDQPAHQGTEHHGDTP